MREFLYELAEKLYRDYPRKMEALTLVFPNRRASLYFRKHLSTFLDRPVFAPKIITIEQFIGQMSPLRIPDKLELVYHLYEVYFELIKSKKETQETFDQFYFWGEMLLRDFDEIDKYLVNTEHLFKDLSNQKELDATFDFLTEEHQEFLKSFWINFQESPSRNKNEFLELWRKLPQVYVAYRDRLRSKRLAYDGMLHREVAAHMSTAELPKDVHFVGFNALTKAEEEIIAQSVAKGASMHWDMDAYYVNNVTQEAGLFFREYQQHPILGKTFPLEIPSHLTEKTRSPKNIKLFGAAQPIGQAKLASQIVAEEVAKGMNPEETLIVLPDEKLLMPVLHGISGAVDKLNVTMGFPVTATPMYNLVELLVELQITRKIDFFNHREVLALLGHPYVVAADTASSHAKRKEILHDNWVHVPKNFLAHTVDLHRLIFREVGIDKNGEEVITIQTYLRDVITMIGTIKALPDFDKEYAFQFLTLINRLEEVTGDLGLHSIGKSLTEQKHSWRSYLRLFRQVVRGQKIPFTGEPLRGLQVMGVLETRNLDYKNVFILSLNEGSFPSYSSRGSYVPFNIRKAYRLPTVEHQDAMYSYLFYRTLQRSENIYLFYNSETDVLGQGEMSRYLQQLIYESGLEISRTVMHHSVQPTPVLPIMIKKDAHILARLAQIGEEGYRHKGISPSALNAFIECRLRFYFRYVAKIKEPREVEDDLDARVLGNFLHKTIEKFYKELRARKGNKTVEKADFTNYQQRVSRMIDEVFREEYKLDPEKPVEYEGQRLVVKEIVGRFVDRIVDIDERYAPFEMEAVEQEGITYLVKLRHAPGEVLLGGVIDRADVKEEVFRIVDYKTGRDELDFTSVASLFEREGKRNKAAFQTMLYALLVKKNLKVPHRQLKPGLMNRKNLFDPNFTFGLKKERAIVEDVTPLLDEFEAHLSDVLHDLYDPNTVFDQTKDQEVCRYCPYQAICYR